VFQVWSKSWETSYTPHGFQVSEYATSGTALEKQRENDRIALLTLKTIVSNYIGLFVGCVVILVSLLPGPIMRGKSQVPHKNQKLTRIVLAVLGSTILLAWYSQR
jgi:hypothetical protein